jgi:hypothetical protein
LLQGTNYGIWWLRNTVHDSREEVYFPKGGL